MNTYKCSTVILERISLCKTIYDIYDKRKHKFKAKAIVLTTTLTNLQITDTLTAAVLYYLLL